MTQNPFPQPARFERLTIIPGRWHAPWNLYLGCSIEVRDGEGAIVDPGAGADVLSEVAARGVGININSHHHGDHMFFNPLFRDAELWISQPDARVYGDLSALKLEYGLQPPLAEDWERSLQPSEVDALTLPIARTLRHGERATIGDTELVFHVAAGHTAGMLCVEFPGQHAIYTADIDLTRFGPWYGQVSCDIDDFINSARAIAEVDVDWYITAHEEGVVDADAFRRRLPGYLTMIDQRDFTLLRRLREPRSLADLMSGGIVYPPRAMANPWTRHWEKMHILVHIERLVRRGAVVQLEDGRWRRGAGGPGV